MMDKDIDLDALFAEAAAVRTDPSVELSARILADATRSQPMPQAFVKPAISTKSHQGFGWFGALGEVLGGGRSLVGLALAGLTGLYLGVAQPTAVQSMTALLSGTATTADQMDLLPATGTLWTGE